jgi:hypothetical protein
LLAEAAAHGVMPAVLWAMTPREFSAVVAGVQRRELRAFASDVAVAWHGAAFARAKQMPNLRRVLRVIVGQDEPPKVQTPDEMLAVVRRWNAVLGGSEKSAPRLVKG